MSRMVVRRGGPGWLALVVAAGVLGALEARASAPPGRYVIANGTVHDTSTNLTWQQISPSGMYTWSSTAEAGSAQAYCQALDLGGFSSGWRLPTMKELVSLVDVSADNPSIDSTAFPGTVTIMYWTSSTYADIEGDVWAVYFLDGGTYYIPSTAPNDVRCVR